MLASTGIRGKLGVGGGGAGGVEVVLSFDFLPDLVKVVLRSEPSDSRMLGVG